MRCDCTPRTLRTGSQLDVQAIDKRLSHSCWYASVCGKHFPLELTRQGCCGSMVSPCECPQMGKGIFKPSGSLCTSRRLALMSITINRKVSISIDRITICSLWELKVFGWEAGRVSQQLPERGKHLAADSWHQDGVNLPVVLDVENGTRCLTTCLWLLVQQT